MLISPYYFLSYSSEVAWYFSVFVYGFLSKKKFLIPNVAEQIF